MSAGMQMQAWSMLLASQSMRHQLDEPCKSTVNSTAAITAALAILLASEHCMCCLQVGHCK